VFVAPEHLADLQATVLKYALQDSPDEPGCWRRLNIDQLCRFQIDQGLKPGF
jgi:hypothetical protein